jgi:hypothetical protein
MSDAADIVNTLYCGFLERGVRYFFPDAVLSVSGAAEPCPSLRIQRRTDGSLDLEWMGSVYRFEQPGRSFTESQIRLLAAIGSVLSARYRGLFSAAWAASTSNLFEGLPEDPYVSAFLDPALNVDKETAPATSGVLTNAIEVMRESSLLTYENRRISTGVILTRHGNGTCPAPPRDALPYTNALVGIKSFHRLCDGLQTAFLVDETGRLVDLVDIRQFAQESGDGEPPAPSAARYRFHCIATLHHGNICLVLTPNGEIKIFAGGVQVFHFMEGRWRLTDTAEKYREFRGFIGDEALAERLFTAALNLAEHRRGGLFVILDDAEDAAELVMPEDLLESSRPEDSNKGQIHYLLRSKCVLDLELSVLQSVARVDGGIVIDRGGRFIAFGAILRNTGEFVTAQEGGRTTAAVHSSRLGLALKISEDGLVSFYRGGVKVWEI